MNLWEYSNASLCACVFSRKKKKLIWWMFSFLLVQWKGNDCRLLSVFQVTSTFHSKWLSFSHTVSKTEFVAVLVFPMRIHTTMHKAKIIINHTFSHCIFISRSINRPMCNISVTLPSKKPRITHLSGWPYSTVRLPSLWQLSALILPAWCQRHGWAGRLCPPAGQWCLLGLLLPMLRMLPRQTLCPSVSGSHPWPPTAPPWNLSLCKHQMSR